MSGLLSTASSVILGSPTLTLNFTFSWIRYFFLSIFTSRISYSHSVSTYTRTHTLCCCVALGQFLQHLPPHPTSITTPSPNDPWAYMFHTNWCSCYARQRGKKHTVHYKTKPTFQYEQNTYNIQHRTYTYNSKATFSFTTSKQINSNTNFILPFRSLFVWKMFVRDRQ